MVKLNIQSRTIETRASKEDIVDELRKMSKNNKTANTMLKALQGKENLEERSLKKLIEKDLNPNATDKDYASFLEEENAQKVAKSLVMLAERDTFSKIIGEN